MLLSAPVDESYDRCRRQWKYFHDYRLIRVTPMGAVYQALREYLELVSYEEPSWVRTRIMQLAGERGVLTDRDNPYDIMVNHAYMAECLARTLRQPTDKPRVCPPKAYLKPTGEWECESYFDHDQLRLMRFVLVDQWDDDRQVAELHSWRTIGDVCVTGLPMTIRVLVIGQSHAGRRRGYWTRAHQHPQTKQLRFARRPSQRHLGFNDSWLSVWREESAITAQAWLEQMSRDRVLSEVAFNFKVRVPEENARRRVLEDISRLATEMDQALRQKTIFPMTRSACDSVIHGPCPLQTVCYSPIEIEPDETGYFERRQR